MSFIKVEGGPFEMGEEKEKLTVALHSYLIAQFPITQALWQAVMGSNPAYFRGKNRPVECVSWDDICTDTPEYPCFLTRINQLFAPELAAKGYKRFALPTEAEWEFAARGGQRWGNYTSYAGGNAIDEVAWYYENSHKETKDVGLKKPNNLGLYDMTGNVWEWCEDDWNEYGKYQQPNTNNYHVIGANNLRVSRVLRGGSWRNGAEYCSVSYRSNDPQSGRNLGIGFRLVPLP